MPDAAFLLEEGVRAERTGALERALEAYCEAERSSAEPRLRAEALTRQADVHRTRCEWDAAVAAARSAVTVARGAGLDESLIEAMIAEANVLMCRGDFHAAVPIYSEVVTRSTDPRQRGIALQNIGSIQAQSGQPRAAQRAFSESLGNFHKAGYTRGEAISLNNLGRLALDEADAARARPLLEQALTYARKVEDADLTALAMLNLGSAMCMSGESDKAQDLAMSALGYFISAGNRWREIECLRLIADINVCCEDMDNARRCYDSALKIAEQIGSQVEARLTRDRLDALARH